MRASRWLARGRGRPSGRRRSPGPEGRSVGARAGNRGPTLVGRGRPAAHSTIPDRVTPADPRDVRVPSAPTPPTESVGADGLGAGLVAAADEVMVVRSRRRLPPSRLARGGVSARRVLVIALALDVVVRTTSLRGACAVWTCRAGCRRAAGEASTGSQSRCNTTVTAHAYRRSGSGRLWTGHLWTVDAREVAPSTTTTATTTAASAPPRPHPPTPCSAGCSARHTSSTILPPTRPVSGTPTSCSPSAPVRAAHGQTSPPRAPTPPSPDVRSTRGVHHLRAGGRSRARARGRLVRSAPSWPDPKHSPRPSSARSATSSSKSARSW